MFLHLVLLFALTSLDVATSPEDTRAMFERIERQVREMKARGERPLLVFDIDDTIRQVKTKKLVKGALAFLARMKGAGATILYVSHRPRFKDGVDVTDSTRRQLRELGFPAGPEEHILLSPVLEWTSSEWKGLAAETEVAKYGTPVAWFENDKPVIRRLRKVLAPRVQVVRMATLLDCTSMADPKPWKSAAGIHVVRDFRMGVTMGDRFKARFTRWTRWARQR